MEIMQNRHAYLLQKAERIGECPALGYVLAECAAVELAIDLMAEEIRAARVARAARYAVTELISRSSC